MLFKNGISISKKSIVILLLLLIEFSYFILCLINTFWLLRIVLVLISLFIIPGALFLTILRYSINNITKLIVEGYFISTIISTMLTSIMLMLGLPLTPLNYSLAMLILVLFLSIIALRMKIEFKLSKPDILLTIAAFLAYVALIIYFSKLPRLFTPDETAYIFSARMGILNGAVPPMGARPDANEVASLFQGRYFWIYLLASFIGSTGLPAHQAGLLSVGFLIMTALASSLLEENKWESVAIFVTIILNQLLFSFSALTLNDLAISFYVVFTVSYFINSFSKINNNLTINIKNLFYSLMGIIVLIVIKSNLMIFVAMWIILIYIILRYNLYKQNLKYKLLLIAMVLPVLIYELCIDIPYVISVWILRNRQLGNIFRKFLFISPAEYLLGLFFAPWWNPTAPTLSSRSFADYMNYLYRILMPESSSVLVSAIILVLPFFILSGNLQRKQDKHILALLTLLSLWLYYIVAVSLFYLDDASRYSLWMIPLWISLTFIVLRDIRDNPSFSKFLMLFMGALILLWINIWLTREKGGVYVGYVLPSRLWTANAVMAQIMLLMLILSLLFLKKDIILRLTISKKLSVEKSVNLKNAVLFLLIALILSNDVYFGFQFIERTKLYEDHGFNMISDTLNGLEYNGGKLIFSNNYIYMRPYVNDKLFQQGLLLPLPDTKEELLKLLEIAPNGTLLLISSDRDTTWYEYCNKYIKDYMNLDIITPEKPTFPKLPNFNLTELILKMTFDDANETTVVDHSGFGNNGINYGAKIVKGYYENALRFDGKQWVSIPNKGVLNVRKEITISFLALINEAQYSKGYMILSKGYAPADGSYDIFIWDGRIYFQIGNVSSLSFPAQPYLGEWHHFIFTYDGKKLEAYVDGVLVASKQASGLIRISPYDLEIGRDSQRKDYYYIGLIDQLQISNKSIDIRELLSYYWNNYAFKIKEATLPTGVVKFYTILNQKSNTNLKEVFIKDSRLYIQKNLTVMLELQIDSLSSKNISILIATDRFTKIYNIPLNKGFNNVKFHFDYIRDPSWYEAGGFYWIHLAKTRVIVIENNTISYNRFITIQNLELMNILFLILLCGLLIFYSIFSLERANILEVGAKLREYAFKHFDVRENRERDNRTFSSC